MTRHHGLTLLLAAAFSIGPAVAAHATLLPSNLLSYYNFNGGTNDSSGNSPAAVLMQGASITAPGGGVFGGGDQALDTSVGGGAHAQIPVGTHYDSATANDTMAVAFWQNRTGNANSSAFWMVAPTSSGGRRGMQAHVPWSNGTIFFDSSGCCAAPGERVTVGVGSPANIWAHYVFQKDAAGNKQVWENGALVIDQVGGAAIFDAFDGSAAIGAELSNPAAGVNSHPGQIDEFSVWNVTLSPDDISRLAAGETASALVIPEPGTFWLLALGMAAFVGLVRRRR